MPPTPVVTVGRLLRARQDAPGLALELLAGAAGVGREITSPYIQKTGLALAGFHDYLRPGRVLIFGDSEIRYLQGLAPAVRLEALTRTVASGIPCILATSTLPLPPEVATAADAVGRAAAARQRVDAGGHRQAHRASSRITWPRARWCTAC